METLARQRCFHHTLREAVARCPECERFFCRECITEHEDRVICAACLRKLAQPLRVRRVRFGLAFRVVAAVLGFLITWLFFHSLGSTLLSIPTPVHDGEIWQQEAKE